MESLNRIIFLVLGLIALIVLLAVVSGRINLKGKLPLFSEGAKNISVTPTPKTSSPSTTKTGETNNDTKPYKTTNAATPTPAKKLTTIPATGLSPVVLAFMFSLLILGYSLHKRFHQNKLSS